MRRDPRAIRLAAARRLRLARGVHARGEDRPIDPTLLRSGRALAPFRPRRSPASRGRPVGPPEVLLGEAVQPRTTGEDLPADLAGDARGRQHARRHFGGVRITMWTV